MTLWSLCTILSVYLSWWRKGKQNGLEWYDVKYTLYAKLTDNLLKSVKKMEPQNEPQGLNLKGLNKIQMNNKSHVSITMVCDWDATVGFCIFK